MRIYLSGFPSYPKLEKFRGVKFTMGLGFRHIARNMSKSELTSLFDELDDHHLWVIRMSGDDPNQFILKLRRLGLLKLWQSRNFLAAFWSMDNHHQGHHELSAAKSYDLAFFAHSFEASFKSLPDNIRRLPCAHNLGRLEDVLRIQGLHSEGSTLDFSFPFRLYPSSYRNLVALQALEIAKVYELSRFVGRVAHKGEDPSTGYIQHLLETNSVLNVSLRKDLNMRSFEALALGRTLIVNRDMQDLEILGDQLQRVLTFEPGNYDSLAGAILESRHIPATSVQDDFFREHSLDERLRDILGEFGIEEDHDQEIESIELPPAKNEWQILSSGDIQHYSLFTYTPRILAARLGLRGFIGEVKRQPSLFSVRLFFWNLVTSIEFGLWLVVSRSIFLKTIIYLIRR